VRTVQSQAYFKQTSSPAATRRCCDPCAAATSEISPSHSPTGSGRITRHSENAPPNSRCTTSLRIADDPADTKEHLRRTRAFAAVHFGKKTSALMPREDGTLEVRLPSGVECGVVFG
jgi:hypothetical protein